MQSTMAHCWLLFGLLRLIAADSSDDVFLPIPGVKTTYRIVSEGAEGAPIVEVGDTVTVHATGRWFTKDFPAGKQFWTTRPDHDHAEGEPFTYKAGGGVIKGWDKGALGMSKF